MKLKWYDKIVNQCEKNSFNMLLNQAPTSIWLGTTDINMYVYVSH